MSYRPRVFVVMPFGVKPVQAKAPTGRKRAEVAADFNLVYDSLFRPAIEQAQCQPFRADEESSAGDIRIDMFFELITADAILADISALNANVFYELGIRHGVAPNGVFVTHGGWGFSRPFDIAPDRTLLDYDGSLFQSGVTQDAAWRRTVDAAVDSLSKRLAEALRRDRETVGSPVYSHLPGLKPVNWEGLHNTRAKYFGGLLTDWKQRIRVAQAEGYPGDILTLAEDAPTRLHREKLLFAAAKGLIDLCRFDIAKEILEEVVRASPDDLDAQCQFGLTLGRLGRINAAMQHMESLVREHGQEVEAQGILGRIYKDMWRLAWEKLGDPAERQRRAMELAGRAAASVRSYYSALERHPDSHWNGINAWTLCRVLEHLAKVTGKPAPDVGEIDTEALPAVVRFAAAAARRRAVLANDQTEQIWSTATLAEAAVMEGNAAEAEQLYGEACGVPGVTSFNKQSMLNQLELLEGLGFNQPVVEAAMAAVRRTLQDTGMLRPRFRKVFVFSGHMIDKPGRPSPRFPQEKEAAVRERLEKVLTDWGAGPEDLALSGAARGGDILFAEICRQRGAHVRLLLPLHEGEFVEESVRIAGSNWERRFYDLVRTSEVWFQDEHLGLPPEGASVHARNNLWILNTGRAEAYEGELYGALVWDEKPTGDGVGGTSHFASEVHRLKGQVEIVNPTKIP